MKLRVKGNSLMFRLTRTELTKLSDEGRVDETIYFSIDRLSKLVYAISHDNHSNSATLRYRSSEILIVLPSKTFKEWIHSDQKGVYATIDLGPRGAIEFLLEKDYEVFERARGDTASLI